MTYWEIIIHFFVATICVVWWFGFPKYIIGLIPFGYYMCAILLEGRQRYLITTAALSSRWSFLHLWSYWCIYLISYVILYSCLWWLWFLCGICRESYCSYAARMSPLTIRQANGNSRFLFNCLKNGTLVGSYGLDVWYTEVGYAGVNIRKITV